MLIPPRCFTCNSIIGHHYEKFVKRVAEGEDPRVVLDEFALYKICCRRMLIAQVDLVDVILPYSKD